MPNNEHKIFIKTSLENIRKAHNENYLSIFAGAGISVGSGLPSWDKLMETLREKLYGKIEKKGEDYLILAENFFNQFGHNFYYKTLRELIPSHAKPNDLHLEIVKLNLKDLITTNWDNLFEKAIEVEGMFFDIIKTDSDVGKSMGFSKLIKMHGSLDRENIVFREKDYLEYSQNFPLIENYIKGVFSTDVVVLVGYSLGDPNVKQIISWVTSCSENIKPIYFIKTKHPFERIEFEFYKNKNIHVLYIHEVLDDKDESVHEKELGYFFEKIKAKEAKRHGTLLLDRREIEDIDRIFTHFDWNALEDRIENLAMFREISLKNKFLRCFLLFENRTDGENISEIYSLYREVSKEAFRNKEFAIWYLSELSKSWCFHSSRHHKQVFDELEEKFLKLPLSEREKLKPITQLLSDFNQKLIAVYHSLMQVLTSRVYWKNGGFFYDAINNSNTALQKLQEFDDIRIGNCLIAPKFEEYRMMYARALECYWCEVSIKILGAKNANKEIPLLPVEEKIFSYSIRYFRTRELKDLFLKYFEGLTLRIQVNEEFLGEIFKNICLKFKGYGIFETKSSLWFGNFLLLASYCLFTQNTFDKIIGEVNHKIQEEREAISLVLYEQLEHFVGKQSQNELDLQQCSSLALTFLGLFVENRDKGYAINAQSIFLKIVGKIPKIDKIHRGLIIGFLDKIHQYVFMDDNRPILAPWLNSDATLGESFKTTLNSDEFQYAQYNQTFLPFIKTLYQSSDEDVKKAIKDKLRYILDHKEDYAQTKASEKYCEWLKELIENLDSSS
ncbi:SIR2 family protein [Helicobacter salomonis]|uniref:SIR2 family protein n=1 Tax=Helicobacter salomonis TaxID=56878 RepID=UPI000CF0F188|nr:SIR2 family protein [Helicobacter salomonis]